MKEFIIKQGPSSNSSMSMLKRYIESGLPNGPVSVQVGRPSRNREQEKKYHAMIGDIAAQVEIEGRKFDTDVWKALLVDSYEQECLSNGERLTHPSKVVISLDGQRAVSLRASTTKFRVSEGTGFIEYLYKCGVDYGVTFSDDSLGYYQEIESI